MVSKGEATPHERTDECPELPNHAHLFPKLFGHGSLSCAIATRATAANTGVHRHCRLRNLRLWCV